MAAWRRIGLGTYRRALVGRAHWTSGRGRPRVLFVCFGLRRFGSADAIRKEALDLHRTLTTVLPSAAGYLVSIEQDLPRPAWHRTHGALLWPQADAWSLIHELQPDFIHVVEDTVGAIFGLGFDRTWLRPTLLTATGADPVQIRDTNLLASLRRAIDLGMLTLIVESKSAAARCDANGLRCSAVIVPGVESQEGVSPGADVGQFTVGFASSPLSEDGWESRGVAVLLDAAATLPNIQFLLAWREGSPSLDETIRVRGLENVQVCRGTIDMADYYRRIHVLVLPFKGASGNHACPLSGVEALARGIPLVVTSDVGLADTIQEYGAGQAVAAHPAAIAAGILRVQEAWYDMRCRALTAGRDRFAPALRAKRYEPFYVKLSRLVPAPIQPSREGGAGERMDVISGREALRRFYESAEVATNYARQRFDSPPLQIAEEKERTAVAEIVSAYSLGRTSLAALDLASGEGRILRTVSALADCTALEPAEAMVQRSRATLPPGHRVRFVRGDAFLPPFRPGPQFDVVTVFRFIRHYAYPDRQLLYAVVRRLIRPEGLFLADFPNVIAETRIRANQGWRPYPVYDVFWSAEEIRHELRLNGFNPVHLVPIGQGLFSDLVPWRDEPLLWVGAFTPSGPASPAVT